LLCKRLKTRDLLLLEILSNNNKVCYRQLAREFGVSKETIRKRLKTFEKLGYIKIIKKSTREIFVEIKDQPISESEKCPNRIDYLRLKLSVGEMIILDNLLKWQYFSLRKGSSIKTLVDVDGETTFWIDYNTLAKQCDMSYESLRRRLRLLEKKGFLKRIERKTARGKIIFCSLAIGRKVGILQNKNTREINYLHNFANFSPDGLPTFRPIELNRNIINNISILSNYYNISYYNNNLINKNYILNYSHPPNPAVERGVVTKGLGFADGGNNISGGRIMDKFDRIKSDIKEGHTKKEIRNINSAITVIKAIAGEIIITPKEHQMIKKLMSYCNEYNIEFKDLIQYAVDNWNQIWSSFGNILSYSGHNKDKFSISVIYNDRVLKYITEAIINSPGRDSQVVVIQKDKNRVIAIMPDGRKKLIVGRDDLMKLKKSYRLVREE
jgi:DNA-binding Lrp family transcriptional regulator